MSSSMNAFFFSCRFSRLNLTCSRALFTEVTSLSRDGGFSRKSNAPSLVERTAISMEPCPLIIIAAVSGLSFFILPRRSMPSMSGSQTSSITTSGLCFFISAMASSPFPAKRTSCPSSCSICVIELIIFGSSSTISISAIVHS